MKILRIVYDWPPPWCGLAPAPYEISVSQARRGHKIVVVSGKWPKSGDLRDLENIKQIKIWREPLPGTMLLTVAPIAFFVILNQIKRFKPDVIHAHGNMGFYYFLYRLFAKNQSIPVVFHLHNTAAGRIEVGRKMGLRTPLFKKYIELPLKKLSDEIGVRVASAVICPSVLIKEEVIKYYKPYNSSKVHVVENGVNTDLFQSDLLDRKDFRERLGVTDKKVIIHYGLIVRRKNPHLLIKALRYLPRRYVLLIVGPGDGEYIESLKGMVVEYGLYNRVKFIDYVPYPDAPAYFRLADIFVLPSFYEGLPKVVMEALATGIPAVVSGFKVQEEIKGLVFLKDLKPKNIAHVIKKVIDSETKVDVGKIRSKFGWDVKAKEIDKIYKGIGL